MKEKADIALIGLAVMGQNLVLNMNDHGYTVAVFNRTQQKTEDFMAGPAKGRKTILPLFNLSELAGILKRPRKIMMMVQAGAAVDKVIESLLPYLEEGDILIDGGNSHFPDTTRRTESLKEKGILYIGTGVSGGEEGARRGPSIMPGGNAKAWPQLKEILQSISAKTETGEACCDWVGAQGAGHYVKMVHNGIEYGDMQLIGEVYDLMIRGLKMDYPQMQQTFSEWNKGRLDSYLIEITADILGYKDDDGSPLLEKILDTAGQKGTGKWTGISALEMGIPVSLIAEAVFARCISALKEKRLSASRILSGMENPPKLEKASFLTQLEKALFVSKIISYAQGFMLIQEAAREYSWDINYGSVALMWRGGCIIRSVFLGKIKEAFDKNPQLDNLLLDDYFNTILKECIPALREVIKAAVDFGIPLPSMSAALSFYDAFRAERLPANLLQAQRDYFGAHSYERTDKARGQFFHTKWTGKGGDVSAGTYSV